MAYEKYQEYLIKKITTAQRETCKNVQGDAQANAPTKSGEYRQSIKVSETKVVNSTITTSVYTDMKVHGGGKNWILGLLLEAGTGQVGDKLEDSEIKKLGLGHRLTPWTYFDEDLKQFITTIGMEPKPHLLPALRNHIKTYKDNLKKVEI